MKTKINRAWPKKNRDKQQQVKIFAAHITELIFLI